jgi:hypothetical protein
MLSTREKPVPDRLFAFLVFDHQPSKGFKHVKFYLSDHISIIPEKDLICCT